MMQQPILQTENLAIGYKRHRKTTTTVAEGLTVQLLPGQLVCLLGPNGAGKSTLMRTMVGMQPALAGRVMLAGDDVAAVPARTLAQKLSVVLTERVDVGLLSAYALVALGRYPYTEWHGRLTPEDERIVQEALQAVGAVPLAARPVNELSDGERQKVMIARALAQEPQLIVLDEPTAFLDLPRRVEIMQILRRLAHEQNRAVLLSTHDLDLAMRSADVIWLMANGRLHVGAPEDLVLNGSFAEAFASQGVAFDMASGTFSIQGKDRGQIDVIGAGIQAEWTVRALKRAGYAVHSGKNGASVRVVCQDDMWQLVDQDGQSEYGSLGELTAVLKETTP